MIFLKVENDAVMEVSNVPCREEGWESRWDWKDFETAEKRAASATLITGDLYIAVDSGGYPRYDVIKAPAIGDKVSYSFNGDYYPEGEIVKVSKTLKVVETSTGKRFYRKKKSGAWMYDKMWGLINGHVDRRNPHI